MTAEKNVNSEAGEHVRERKKLTWKKQLWKKEIGKKAGQLWHLPSQISGMVGVI